MISVPPSAAIQNRDSDNLTRMTSEVAAQRTDAKLRYAKLHLDKVSGSASRGTGDDFERAHHESALAHLLGARDAFLQEINLIYRCGLAEKDVSLRNLSKHFGESPCLGLKELNDLGKNKESWYAAFVEIRHGWTHRKDIGRQFARGGGGSLEEIDWRHPEAPSRSQLETYRDFAKFYREPQGLFQAWHRNMKELLLRLRDSANATK
jgi:hypothetical protein